MVGRSSKAGAGDRREGPKKNGSSLPTGKATDRLRPFLLAGLTSLYVVRLLFPSESAAEGDGLPVVMLWIALAVVWLLGVVGRREFRLRFGWTDLAVLVFIVLYAISALWAARCVAPRPALNMLWEWIAMALSFFLAASFSSSGTRPGL